MERRVEVLCLGVALIIGSCADSADRSIAPDPPELEYIAQESDFDCMLDWPKVGKYRITNKLGRLEDALAIAEGQKKGEFPIGTIIQLVPVEAMVKRGNRFAPEANDWEFFFLLPKTDEAGNPVGKTIDVRGARETVNRFGGNCFDCHVGAKDFDFICQTDRGCDPIPFAEAPLIDAFQEADASCAG